MLAYRSQKKEKEEREKIQGAADWYAGTLLF